MSLFQLNKILKASRILATGNRFLCSCLGKGVAASTEQFNILKSLRLVNTVIDIGANRGQFSLAARYCFPNAQIFAFEPLPKPYATFQRLFSSDTNTRVYKSAIGPSQASVDMHISGRDDSSSLLAITETQDELFPGTGEVGTTTIQVDRLDSLLSISYLQGPVLLKIDVQGYEAEALQGATGLLSAIDYIYVECSFVELYKSQALAHEIIDWLHERGFVLSGVFNMAYDKHHRAVQADFLFRSQQVVGKTQ